MRILHIETGRHIYGGARQVIYLLNALTKESHQQALLVPHDSKVADECPVDIEKYTCKYTGEHDIRLLFKTLSICRQWKPDVIHVHSRRGADLWGGIASRLSGIPSVCTRRVDNKETKNIIRLKLSSYTAIAAISSPIEKYMRDIFPEKHIVKIPSAVHFPESRNEVDLHSRYNIPRNRLLIGIVAQLIYRKGHHILFQALKKLDASKLNWHLLVFGQGKEKATLEKQAEDLGLENRIQFVGFAEDIEDVLPKLDLLAHPALAEGLGVILMQAAAAQVPIVSTPAGGITDILENEHSALLTEPGNADELATAIERIIEDDSLQSKLTKNALAKMKQDQSIESMARAYLHLYDRLLTKDT